MEMQLTESEKEIVYEIATIFGTTPELLEGPCRAPECVKSRWILWLILYNQGNSLQVCGQKTGGHHYSTIIYGFEKLEYEIVQNTEYLKHFLYFQEKYNLAFYEQIKKTPTLYHRRFRLKKSTKAAA